MSPVLRRTLAVERRPILGWAVATLLIVLVTAGSWPGIADAGAEVEQILENLPDALTAFFGDSIGSFSAASVVGSRLFGTIGMALMIGYAVSRGARNLAGEEAAGTLEVVITQPISRTAVAVDKVGAMLVCLAGLVALEVVALLVMMPLVGLDLAVGRVLAAATGLYLLAAMFGCIAFAVGAATGRRTAAVAVGGGGAGALFLLTGLGALVEGLEAVARISPFTHYDGAAVLAGGLSPLPPLVFALVGLAAVLAGTVAFRRRDLA